MSNPLEEFLEEYGTKEAFDTGGLRRFGGEVRKGIEGGLGAGIAAAGIGAAAMGARSLFDAATSTRDFRRMLAQNPDIQKAHEANPRQVNQFYSTLRTMNPTFAKDPVVAAHYMRQMVEFPNTAGGVAIQAVSMRDKFPSFLDRPVEEGMGVAKGHFAIKPIERPGAPKGGGGRGGPPRDDGDEQ